MVPTSKNRRHHPPRKPLPPLNRSTKRDATEYVVKEKEKNKDDKP